MRKEQTLCGIKPKKILRARIQIALDGNYLFVCIKHVEGSKNFICGEGLTPIFRREGANMTPPPGPYRTKNTGTNRVKETIV